MINPWSWDERQVTGEKEKRFWNETGLPPVARAMRFHLTPGPVLSLREALEEIVSGRYVFLGEIPYHSKWAANWSIHWISRLCENGRIRKAEEL